MYDITALYEAASVAEAIELRRAHPEARLIAGGSDLLVKIRDGKLTGAELISIRGIAELAGVCEMPDGTLKIGPLTSFSQLAADTLIRERMPALGEPPACPPAPAIRNAILQATGLAFNAIPITPEALFRAQEGGKADV